MLIARLSLLASSLQEIFNSALQASWEMTDYLESISKDSEDGFLFAWHLGWNLSLLSESVDKAGQVMHEFLERLEIELPALAQNEVSPDLGPDEFLYAWRKNLLDSIETLEKFYDDLQSGKWSEESLEEYYSKEELEEIMLSWDRELANLS